jgi:ribosome-binding protein aMBF1 (putative translation factor)
MRQLNPEKVAKLHSFDNVLDEKYGKTGTPTRMEFHEKALTYYYSEILRDTRKKKRITQRELAEKIGKKREYVTLLEQGKTDMQLSTFLRMSEALGLNFTLA